MTATSTSVPAALRELCDLEFNNNGPSQRGIALDALVDDAWTRVSPDDERWQAISQLLIDGIDGSKIDVSAFLSMSNFAQRLITLNGKIWSDHVDECRSVAWSDIREIERMQAELGDLVDGLKATLAAVQS